MADLAITITNSLLLCGLERTTRFGAATFGVSKWTIGSHDLDIHFEKYISNTLTFTPDLTYFLDYNKLIENSIALAFETSSEGLNDGGGWNYVFPRPSLDAEERNPVSFNTVAGATTAWTTALVGATIWS